MTNYCTSKHIVQKMGEGMHPQEACRDVMRYMAKSARDLRSDRYCVIAINPRGEIGTLSMNTAQPLQYALHRNGAASFHTAEHYLT